MKKDVANGVSDWIVDCPTCSASQMRQETERAHFRFFKSIELKGICVEKRSKTLNTR